MNTHFWKFYRYNIDNIYKTSKNFEEKMIQASG